MKVLLVNGSPRRAGCTFTALSEMQKTLATHGVEGEIFQLGTKPVRGCIDCERCVEERLGRCVFDDDIANRLLEAMQQADGIVLGSPVYYGGPNGGFCAVLDRVFYSGSRSLANKPAAVVASCRRAGSTAALDRLQKYVTINNMPLVNGFYWSMVHGNTPEEVYRDEEGMANMRQIAHNMAHLLQGLEKAGMGAPVKEKRVFTNFIR